MCNDATSDKRTYSVVTEVMRALTAVFIKGATTSHGPSFEGLMVSQNFAASICEILVITICLV
jgi:hypothetical protein